MRSASRFSLPREPASPASEGLEPFDLREIGGQSRARELESVPWTSEARKVEKGVRCGSPKLRRFRRAGFSAEAPKRYKGKMPKEGAEPTGNVAACPNIAYPRNLSKIRILHIFSVK